MDRPETSRKGEPFFLIMAVVLTGAVLGGFSSSFYLRDDTLPPLPAHIYVHGVFSTLWFGWIVVQTALISLVGGAIGIRWHRWLGTAGVLVAIGVVATGIDVATEFYRGEAKEIVVAPPALLFGNLVNALGFGVCFVWAVALRKQPIAHKRFMTWASVVIIGPASFRLATALGAHPAVSVAAQFAFIAALFVYDKKRLGRIHLAAWVGLGIVLLQIVGSFTLGQTAIWEGIAKALFGAS